ncbi:MAG: XdhC family protein [Acetobacterium sp.]
MENSYFKLVQDLKKRNQLVMITTLKKNDQDGKTVIDKSVLNTDQLDLDSINEDMKNALNVLKTGLPELIRNPGNEAVLYEPFYAEGRLIILGGGHIAKPLAKYGSEIGFAVTVVDDRPSFANPGRFPEASVVLCESFEQCFKKLEVNSSDYIVIVTRGHRHDAVCLRQVLGLSTEYLGMIGSKRRVKSLMELLIEEGFTKDEINEVCAPIGLEIGAITPEEIAISIIAQIISKKRLNQTSLQASTKKQRYKSDYDYEVLENLANDHVEKRAIITVVSKKGSVPRGPGAKMIVWPDGRILGSIGGGCSEAEVILVARDLIHSGGYAIEKIDMTGSVAEDEGMVCGGIMEVLIEVYPG